MVRSFIWIKAMYAHLFHLTMFLTMVLIHFEWPHFYNYIFIFIRLSFVLDCHWQQKGYLSCIFFVVTCIVTRYLLYRLSICMWKCFGTCAESGSVGQLIALHVGNKVFIERFTITEMLNRYDAYRLSLLLKKQEKEAFTFS